MSAKDPFTKERLFSEILKAYGEDPDREGLKGTPDRWERSFDELLSGYTSPPPETFFTTFEEGASTYNSLVIVKDISFYSLCEHHVLPFFGQVHIGYLPGDKIAGLSKFARLVDYYSRRLQVQERLTTQIANKVQEILEPRAVFVVVQAEHLCMTMRGVQKPGSTTVTSALLGEADTIELKQEFFSLVRGQ